MVALAVFGLVTKSGLTPSAGANAGVSHENYCDCILESWTRYVEEMGSRRRLAAQVMYKIWDESRGNFAGKSSAWPSRVGPLWLLSYEITEIHYAALCYEVTSSNLNLMHPPPFHPWAGTCATACRSWPPHMWRRFQGLRRKVNLIPAQPIGLK